MITEQHSATGTILVNDIHSQLNLTSVREILRPGSAEEIATAMRDAAATGVPLSISGERHAMGGQQFASGGTMIDMRGLNRVLRFDRERGLVEAEAGINWRDLFAALRDMQEGTGPQWGVAQKQTGADLLSLGGAVASNIHGRGLRFKPFIQDIESLMLIGPDGELRRCSRTENPELFRLAVGGYGLFGLVYSVEMRLIPRRKVERTVRVITTGELMDRFQERIDEGYLYGDFQFAIDERSDDFLRTGIFSCYRPVDDATPIPAEQKELSEREWMHLLYLAHADKEEGFRLYSDYYLSTDGQVYWSDTHQLTPYLNDYHHRLDATIGGGHKASEIITEIYIPRPMLADFLREVAEDFRAHDVNLIYGTIRLIEQDTESFLAWAREAYACVIFNLHTPHTPEGIEHSGAAFRRLTDMAIRRGGSYFLTYHRFATRAQVDACYPQFEQFLQLKRQHDPGEILQSDWYRHYSMMYMGD